MYTSDDDFDVVDAVRAVAAGRGVPAAQVALSWLLRQPAVSAPIVGATRLAHLEDAIAAVDLSPGRRGSRPAGGPVPSAPRPGSLVSE